MSGSALKRISPWLKEKCMEQTDAKKGKIIEQNTIDYPYKYEGGFENYSFVKRCSEKAQQKKIVENAINYSKTSRDFSCPSMLIKFQIFMFLKMFNRLYCFSFWV